MTKPRSFKKNVAAVLATAFLSALIAACFSVVDVDPTATPEPTPTEVGATAPPSATATTAPTGEPMPTSRPAVTEPTPTPTPSTVELSVLIEPPDTGIIEIGGSAVPSGVAKPIQRGDLINLTARPAEERWQFSHWEGDLTGPEAAQALHMDSAKIVRAVFRVAGPATVVGANFSANPVTGQVPLTVAFKDLSDGRPTNWEWDFQNDEVVDNQE